MLNIADAANEDDILDLTLCFTNEAWFYLFIRLRQQSKQPRLVSD
jgi:hypothetical protein